MANSNPPALRWTKIPEDILRYRPCEKYEIDFDTIEAYLEELSFHSPRGCVWKNTTSNLVLSCQPAELMDKINSVIPLRYWQRQNITERSSNLELTCLFDTGCLELSKHGLHGLVTIQITCLEEAIYKKIVNIIQENSTPPAKIGAIYVMTSTNSGPKLSRVGDGAYELETENYTEDISRELNHISQDLISDNPCGRVIILEGPPGCGKTYAIRALCKMAERATFIIVQPSMVASLARPELIQALLSKRQENPDMPIVLIIEDADTVLVTRGADNSDSISSMLNLSDGILGTILDIRIIASTNAPKTDIDPAIVRAGRLCRYLRVEKLARERAEAVYKRLTGVDMIFNESKKLADIYNLARNNGWTPPRIERRPAGFFRDENDWDL